MVSEAQQRAKKKWDDKNRDKNRIYRYRSYARKFIRDLATDDDLKELQIKDYITKAIANGYRLLFCTPHKTIWGRLGNKKWESPPK